MTFILVKTTLCGRFKNSFGLIIRTSGINFAKKPELTSSFELYHRCRPSQTSCCIIVVDGNFGHVLCVRLELRDRDCRDVSHERLRINRVALLMVDPPAAVGFFILKLRYQNIGSNTKATFSIFLYLLEQHIRDGSPRVQSGRKTR